MIQKSGLLYEIECAVFEKSREYENPNNIDELRTYHVFNHGNLVAQEVLDTDRVACKRSATNRMTMIAISLAHDIIPPNFITDIDTRRPWPFTYKRVQVFDGQSEAASYQWFIDNFGDRFDDDLTDFVYDGFKSTTTIRSKSGEIRQPEIINAKDPKAAFIIAKADILGHQFTAIPRSQVDINLRIWLEQFPDFVAKLYDPNYDLKSETYDFICSQITKIPEFALNFYNQQLELFHSDGEKIFRPADLKAMHARLFLANTTPLKTFDNPDWPWLKNNVDLLKRLRTAIGIKPKS